MQIDHPVAGFNRCVYAAAVRRTHTEKRTEIGKRGLLCQSFWQGGTLGKHKETQERENSWVPLGFKEAISLHFLLSICVSEETEKWTKSVM